MNTAVPMITVRELIERGEADVQTGPFGTQLKASEYVESGTPVINVRNVGFGDIRDADLEFITEAKTEQLKAHKLRKGDIVFGRKGAVERHALIADDQDGWVQGSDCLRLRLASDTVCERYASYYLRTRAHQDWMQALCSFGATMASLNQDIVKRITIPLPEFPTQRKIAAILTAYDDLIETNKRRIALLEKMAEELYREWFVRMRFPGHQNTKFIKGVPVGWEVRPMGKVAKIVMGLSPKGNTYNESGVGMPLVNGPVEFTERFTKRVKWTTAPNKKCTHGDLIVCVRGSTTGKFVKSDGEYCLGRGVCSISAEHQSFVDQMFKEQLPTLLGMTSGSTFPSWTGPQLQSHLVFSPPEKLKAMFEDNALPMNNLVQELAQQNAILTRTRDLLLPRLISGKLSVEDLDIQFPPSMQEGV